VDSCCCQDEGILRGVAVVKAIASLQIHCKRKPREEVTAGGKRGLRSSGVSATLAAFVLAITAYFHHMRFLGLFAILAAVFAVFFRGAIAGGMRAFGFCILGHKRSLLSGGP
jgi:hypothetical protein